MSEAIDYVNKNIGGAVPTFMFSFFDPANIKYNSQTGGAILENVSSLTDISIVSNIDRENARGYAIDAIKSRTDNIISSYECASEIISHIYGERQIQDTYKVITSSGLTRIKLEKPLTYECFQAARGIITDYSDFADTDDDGLYDFEEIDCLSTLFTVDSYGEVVEYPTYAKCMNARLDKDFYVDVGLEKYKEILKRNNQYTTLSYLDYLLDTTRVLPINSDPTSANGDGDEYLDIQERKRMGSNPLKINSAFSTNTVNYLTNDIYYTSQVEAKGYLGDSIYQAWMWVCNNIYKQNGSVETLYKRALIEYINMTYSDQMVLNEQKNLHRLLNDIKDGMLLNIEEVLSNGDLLTSADKSLLIETQQSLVRLEKDLSSVYMPGVCSKERYYQIYDENMMVYNELTQRVGSLKKSIKVKVNLGKAASVVLDFASGAKEILDDYSSLKSNIEYVDLATEILLAINNNTDDSRLMNVTYELLQEFNNHERLWQDAVRDGGVYATEFTMLFAINAMLLEAIGTTMFLIFESSDLILKNGERGYCIIQTVAMSQVSCALSKELLGNFQNCINIYNTYYLVYDNFDYYRNIYYGLARARLLSEKYVIDFFETFPLYFLWYGNDHNYNLAYKNIETLNQILQSNFGE